MPAVLSIGTSRRTGRSRAHAAQSVTSLAQAARARRLDAFARAHYSMLYAVAVRLCADPVEAADLVQDTLERALRNFDQLHPNARESAWVVTILHNLFIDRCRSRRRQPRHEPMDQVPDTAIETPSPAPAWSRISLEQLRTALDRLDDEFRVAYEQHALDGRSYKQIAADLHIPMATVGTRIMRARHKLKELLRPLVVDAG
jgi:RNA polymerase sigma-70 factor (ECF subfamily)